MTSRKQTPVSASLESQDEFGIPIRPQLLERLAKTKGSDEALNEVHLKLASATEVFQHIGDGGRAGVYRAVSSAIGRWPRKFGHGLKWSFCLTAAIMLQLRRDDDEENKA